MKSFRTWLRPYKKEDTPLGDLARGAFVTPEWTDNTHEGLYKALHKYIGASGYCEARTLLREAVELYKSECMITENNTNILQ